MGVLNDNIGHYCLELKYNRLRIMKYTFVIFMRIGSVDVFFLRRCMQRLYRSGIYKQNWKQARMHLFPT